jgi:hypothetical protein
MQHVMVLLFDESSMISGPFLKRMLDRINLLSGVKDRTGLLFAGKVTVVGGDARQMPPVRARPAWEGYDFGMSILS